MDHKSVSAMLALLLYKEGDNMVESTVNPTSPHIMYGQETITTGPTHGDILIYFPRGVFTKVAPIATAILFRDHTLYDIKYTGSYCDTEQQSAWVAFQVFNTQTGNAVTNTSITFRYIAVGR